MTNHLKNAITVNDRLFSLCSYILALITDGAPFEVIDESIKEYFQFLELANQEGICTFDVHKKASAYIGSTLNLGEINPIIFKEVIRRFPHGLTQIGTSSAHENPEAALHYICASFKNCANQFEYESSSRHALAIAQRAIHDPSLVITMLNHVKDSFPELDVSAGVYRTLLKDLCNILFEFRQSEHKSLIDSAIAESVIFLANKIKLNSNNGFLSIEHGLLPKLLGLGYFDTANALFANFNYSARDLEDYEWMHAEFGLLLSDEQMEKRLKNIFTDDPHSKVDLSTLVFSAASMIKLKLKLEHVEGYSPILEIFNDDSKCYLRLAGLINKDTKSSSVAITSYADSLFTSIRRESTSTAKELLGVLAQSAFGLQVLEAAKASRASARVIINSELSL